MGVKSARSVPMEGDATMGFSSRTSNGARRTPITGALIVLMLAIVPPASAGLAESTTTVSPQTIGFSAAAQDVFLMATVTQTSGGSPITSGMVTFQVKNGMTPVGTAVTDTTLTAAGVADVLYSLPAGTAAGFYTIEASFTDGETQYQDSGGTNTLTVFEAGNLVIEKVTNPAGDPTSFSFLWEQVLVPPEPASIYNSFFLAGGQTWDSGPLVPGTYTVMESVPTGWNVTDLSCSDPSGGSSATGDTATIDLAAGETVTCTFTNTATQRIIIDKVTFPAGDPTSFDFELTQPQLESPVTVGGTLFSLTDSSPPWDSGPLAQGFYEVTETLPPGWEFDFDASFCDDQSEGLAGDVNPSLSIFLDPGETVTCTFVNIKLSDVGFSKAFFPDTIGPGSTTQLRFDIDNIESATPVTDLAFTDVLPAGITIATPSSASTDCTDAVLTAPDGGTTISLTGGRLGANSSCSVAVNVIGTSTATNTSGDLTSSDGTSGAAVATLTVDQARPSFEKTFAPSSVSLGGTSTLTLTISSGGGANSLQFVDVLPDGMVIASPTNLSNTCGGTVSFGETSDSILLTGGSVGAESSCAVSVDVTTTTTGTFDNVSDELFYSASELSAGFATATLEVPLEPLNKAFINDPVPPGATTTLRFTVLNPSRTAIANDMTFSDPLPAGLSLASGPVPDPPCGAGSTLTGATTLTFAGGTLPPGGSCMFDVVLDVPAGATPGTYTNTTTSMSGDIAGEGFVGNAATDEVMIAIFPLFTKEFTDDPVGAGGRVTLEFTLTNTGPSAMMGLEFEDLLAETLPGLAANSLVDGDVDDPMFDICGDGSVLTVFNPPDIVIGEITIVTPPDPTMLIFSGGSLAAAGSAGDSCTFSVVLDVPAGAASGVYPNTTSDLTGATADEEPITGLPATDDLIVVGAVALNKEFTDDPVNPPGNATLEFTITNLNDTDSAAGVTFSDDLAAMVPSIDGLAAIGLPLVDLCGPGNGMLTGSAGDTLMTFSGGSLAPGASCTFSVSLSVPGSAAIGAHTNTTSAIVATVGGIGVIGNQATDDLRIAGLTLSKEFLDDPVIPGDTVTLEFVIENVNLTETATGITIRDDMATILGGSPEITGDGVTATDVCGPGNGIVEWTAGDTFMTFSGGTLAPGEMCTFRVVLDVPAGAVSGTYVNSTGTDTGPGFVALMPPPTQVIFDEATDDLVVNNVFLDLTKEFTDDPVEPGGTANLRFSLTNLSPVESLFEVAFSDDLGAALAGLVATGLPVAGCGGTLATSDGGQTLDFAGGSFDPSQSCFFDVPVSVPVVTIGTVAINTTSGVTGLTLNELGVVGDPATDQLRIGFLTLTKAFARPTKAGETVDLTFTLTNLAPTPAGDLGFTDDLDAVVAGLVATDLPIGFCGGTLFSPDDGSTLILVGGSLAAAGSPGDSCSVTVTLQVPIAAPLGTFTNITSDLLQRGVSVGDPAVADLEIEPALAFSKTFLPDAIGPGSTSQLRFTIENLDKALLAGEIAFSDVLPAGLVIAKPSSASTDCTDGSLTAPDGGTVISLSGARLGVGATCTVTVNVTAAAVGTYDNVSGELTSNAGSGGAAAATLTVDAARPGFVKSFVPGTIPLGGKSVLTLTIDNGANPGTAGELEFIDVLPAGMLIATPANAATDCDHGRSTPILTAGPGPDGVGQVISLVGGNVGGGSVCTVTVDVTTDSTGVFVNTTGELLFEPLGEVSGILEQLSSGFATAALNVPIEFLVKSFIDDPVLPGGVVTLQFIVTNLDRSNPASNIAFDDTIDPLGSLTGLAPNEALPKAACGGVLDFAAGTLNLTGASLPADGVCTFSVELAVPAAAFPGTFTNTTEAITAEIDGQGIVGNMATDDLVINYAPILTKEFTDDPVAVGGDVTLEFTITNTNPTSSLSDIAFIDELTSFLPFPVSVTPPTPDPPCGAGSSLAVVSLGTERQGLSLNGGSLPAAGMCAFEVTLAIPVGVAGGSYTNTTSEISALIDGEIPVDGLPASDDLAVVAGPRLTKEFTDDPVLAGGTVTLEFTLEHDALAPGDATEIGFTDNLAAVIPGLAATLPSTPDPPCGPGSSLTGSAGDTMLTFAGATLGPGESCTFGVTLTVPDAVPGGIYGNTTSNVVATVLGLATTENPASDALAIGGLTLTKEFIDDPVIAGGTVMLEFVITNQSPDPISQVFFEDALDPDVLPGLTVVSVLPTEPCGLGSVLETYTDPSIVEGLRLSGGNLPPTGGPEGSDTCSFIVELEVPAGTPPGIYVNRTTGFSAVIGDPASNVGDPAVGQQVLATSFPNATDDLLVANEQLLLTKEFIDDPVLPGDTVTLEFAISTLGVSESASDLAFSDDLGAALPGLIALGPFDTGTCGGTLTGAGSSFLDYSGGSFSGGDCSFSVTLQVPAAVPFGTTITNTTSGVTGTIDGLEVTGEPASDDLLVDFFVFTKSFDGLTKPTGTPVLRFTIENLSTEDLVAGLGFSDDLDAVLPGLVATNLPTEPCGLGSAINGTSLLTLTGGNLLPGGSCTFSVDLLVPANAPGGDFLNTTSELQIAGVPFGSPATALLSIEPSPVFGKAFLPDFIPPRGRSGLTFLIENTSVFAVTDLAFSDNLPVGVVVAPSADIGTNCSGATLTAVEGSGVITFSGGELSAGGSCLTQVDVTSEVPGFYINISEPLTSSSGTSASAIDTLVVVGSGEPCPAPDGENATVQDDTVTETREVVVCDTITVGPNVGVLGPDGNLILRAGVAVVIEELVVGVDAELTVSNESVLIP
jgi:hypothetical protein